MDNRKTGELIYKLRTEKGFTQKPDDDHLLEIGTAWFCGTAPETVFFTKTSDLQVTKFLPHKREEFFSHKCSFLLNKKKKFVIM